MVRLTRKTRFSAAHRYYLDDCTPEENERLFGPCALPHGHGHDYVVEVTVAGEVDPANGMVVNITDLKPLLDAEVTQRLDGEYLTPQHPLLQGRIPSTEVLARILWAGLEAALVDGRLPARLEGVLVAESRRLWGECRRGEYGPMVTLTRVYEFAAAHRLHSTALADEANRALFGKCNNPHGHGHNYLLEVTVGGEPDPRTGLIANLEQLDRVVHEQVVDRYDHRHLNLDVEEFRDLNPTSENLVRVIWERLEPALPAGTLRRVTVRETERNIFSYEGPGAGE
jgi:6-pyruvoyltetrahydropterin/6-carboxytetrahydropterin synthase